jgi:hypothetical protein
MRISFLHAVAMTITPPMTFLIQGNHFGSHYMHYC